jgi:quinol monooxygenase YgiN
MGTEAVASRVFVRFARFRFKDGKEADGLRILRGHADAIRSAPGCRDAWLGQGQHPATECVLIALFDDEDSLRKLEGRLRSDPARGGDFFALLALTTQPPEVVPYEVREKT